MSDHIASGSFPTQLITFLGNPQVHKVGHNIALDLKNLQDDSGSSIPFIGGVDLGQLAKAKNIVSDAWAGLSELCIKTLSCILPKDLNTRISTDWSADELTEDQIQYAALDAWASLKIYEKLISLQIPASVDFNARLPAGYQVFIYQQDCTTIIARGIISPDSFQSFQGINITQTRVLIRVNDVYVPGAIISLHRGHLLVKHLLILSVGNPRSKHLLKILFPCPHYLQHLVLQLIVLKIWTHLLNLMTQILLYH